MKKNNELIFLGLAIGTFGNASAKDGESLLIKPSGVELDLISQHEISVVEISTGKLLSGKEPSTDTPTHLELYRSFPQLGGIVHTHSPYATAWAQAAKPIPCIGTTHADYWKDSIPLTRELNDEEIKGEYELETGKIIVKTLKLLELDPLMCPGILVVHHGPFAWGRSVEEAVKHAEMLEYVAKLAWMTLKINPRESPIPSTLYQRHFSRKHGPLAYYGQKD